MALMPDPAPRADDAPSYARGLTLKLSLKGQPVQRFDFEQETITVGRDPDCDVYVDNPGVSRLHFRIRRGDTGEFRVSDEGSSNGTYLNNRPIQVATLRDGDSIQFGKYAIDVTIDELVGAGGASRHGPPPATDGATVMLSPAEVRQMVADAQGGGAAAAAPRRPAHAPHAPRLEVVKPGMHPAADPEARAWAVWLGLGVGVLGVAAAVVWWLMR